MSTSIRRCLSRLIGGMKRILRRMGWRGWWRVGVWRHRGKSLGWLRLLERRFIRVGGHMLIRRICAGRPMLGRSAGVRERVGWAIMLVEAILDAWCGSNLLIFRTGTLIDRKRIVVYYFVTLCSPHASISHWYQINIK